MSPTNSKLVIFDFDGTLADTYPAFVRALESVIASQGLAPIGSEELEGFRGGHGRALMRRLGVRWWQVPRVSAAMLKAITKERDSILLFVGAADLLARLADAGIRIAIVSSNSEENVRAVLGQASRHVDIFECGAKVFGKRRKFLRVLRQAGVDAFHAVAVGDELRDHDAARAAGVRFAAVTWGFTTVEALAASCPDMMVSSFDDLARRCRDAAA